MDINTDYKIQLTNDSETRCRFTLLYEEPVPPNNPSQKFALKVGFKSYPTERKQKTEFTVSTAFFAMFGTSAKSHNGDVQFDIKDCIPAKLGPGGLIAVLTTEDGAGFVPKWDDAAMAAGRKTATPGALVIKTDGTFPSSFNSQTYIGVGHRGPDESNPAVPSVMLQAGPNLYLENRPVVKYYISMNENPSGSEINFTTIRPYLQIDFTGCTVRNAKFSLNSEKTFDPDESVATNGVKWRYWK